MMSAASAGLWPLDRARDVDTNAGGWPTADARMAGDGDAVVVETAGQTRHGLLERVQLVEQVVHAFRRGAIKLGRLGAPAKVSPAVWLIETVMSTGKRRSAGPGKQRCSGFESRATPLTGVPAPTGAGTVPQPVVSSAWAWRRASC